MTEPSQANLPWPVIGAAVTGAVSIFVFAVTNWRAGERARLARSREIFSNAYAATQEYKEFPYDIRRRRNTEPEEDRIRISTELRGIQREISFYSAWIQTESPHVGLVYSKLVDQMRQVAGTSMRDAWNEPAVESDAEMNIPGKDLTSLGDFESAFLKEVIDHLSFWPRWMRRTLRKIQSN